MIGQIRCDIVLIEEFAKATVMFGMERSFTLKRFRIRVAGAVAAGEMMKITQCAAAVGVKTKKVSAVQRRT